ncbi:MAG: hypothetical protein WCP97_07800 [bacterium]
MTFGQREHNWAAVGRGFVRSSRIWLCDIKARRRLKKNSFNGELDTNDGKEFTVSYIIGRLGTLGKYGAGGKLFDASERGYLERNIPKQKLHRRAWHTAQVLSRLSPREAKEQIAEIVTPFTEVTTFHEKLLTRLTILGKGKVNYERIRAEEEKAQLYKLVEEIWQLREKINEPNIEEQYISKMMQLSMEMQVHYSTHMIAKFMSLPKLMQREGPRKAAAFLAGLGIGTGVVLIKHPEARSALFSLRSRENPGEGVSDVTDLLNPSEEIKNKFWETVVQPVYGNEAFPFEQWASQLNGLGDLANYCYFRERKKDETYDDYFYRYCKKSFDTCEKTGTNFILYAFIQQISSTMVGDWAGQLQDVTIGHVQQILGAGARLFGAETAAKMLVADNRKPTSIQQALGQSFARALSPKLPLSWEDMIRIVGPVTMGCMDMPTIFNARGLMKSDGKGGFIDAYPEDVMPAWNRINVRKQVGEVLQAQQELEKRRATLQAASYLLIEKSPGVFDDFFGSVETNKQKRLEAFKQIGIAYDAVEDWQLTNPTEMWKGIIGIQYSLESTKIRDEIIDDVISSYSLPNHPASSDLDVARRQHLMGDQIHNPRFLPYLEQRLKAINDVEGPKVLKSIIDAKTVFDAQVQVMRDKTFELELAFGEYEYDSAVQVENSVAAIKVCQLKLEKKYGAIDRSNKDQLAWAIFGVASMVNISPLSVLVGGIFGREASVDPVHDDEGILQLLDKLTARLTFSPRENGKFALFRTILGLASGMLYDTSEKIDEYEGFLQVLKGEEDSPGLRVEKINSLVREQCLGAGHSSIATGYEITEAFQANS